MAKIAVITDTDASFSQEFAVSHGITMVPIMVQFGEEGFRDTFDITNSQVFSRIDKEGKLPTTSAPSPGQFRESFLNAFNSGYESVICFTVSSEVSATYASAVNARNEFPDKDISIIDSKSLTMQQGYMVLEGVHKRKDGEIFPVEVNVSFITLHGHDYMVAVARDVTERKRVEGVLQKERNYLEKLHDSLGDAVFTIKLPEGVISFANSSVESIFGYRPWECIGLATAVLYPDEMSFHDFGKKLERFFG